MKEPTEIPLESTKHFQHSRDEAANSVAWSSKRYVDHPHESNYDVGHLFSRQQVEPTPKPHIQLRNSRSEPRDQRRVDC